MKALNTHLLQLAVDGLDHRTMLTDEPGVFGGVATHIATLFGNQANSTMNVAQQIIHALRRTDWQRFSDAARRTAEQYDWTYIATRYTETFHTIVQAPAEKLGNQR